MTGRRNARRVFLDDQIQAAQSQLQERFHTANRDAAVPLDHPAVTTLQQRFMAALATGRVGDCQHLTGNAPAPIVWFASAPARGHCFDCAKDVLADLHRRSTPVCDLCGMDTPDDQLMDVQIGLGGILVVGLTCPSCARPTPPGGDAA